MVELGKLLDWGFVFPVFSGIQIDINVVLRLVKEMMEEAMLCNHSCTDIVGEYDCPAAFLYNKGLKKKYLASMLKILEWIEIAAEGLRRVRDDFLRDDKGFYLRYNIPPIIQEYIKENLRTGKIEVNLFGGNPEMHPAILELVVQLRLRGFIVNLTTTGRSFLEEKTFFDGIKKASPHLIAVSADDFEIRRLKDLLKLDTEELRQEWRKIPKDHGQAQKFLEGVYTAKLFSGMKEPKLLFNMVIHRKNIAHVGSLINALAKQFPNVLINPYPMQASFAYKSEFFDDSDLKMFHRFVDRMIDLTISGAPFITKRLHYWIVMKAVFLTYKADTYTIRRMVAGYGTWQCYREPNIPYLQIGRGPKGLIITDATAGGKLGCFWNNQTVTQSQTLASIDQVSEYLSGGMKELARRSAQPCPGCNMPRLWFNVLSTWAGISPKLVPAVLHLQEKHLGF